MLKRKKQEVFIVTEDTAAAVVAEYESKVAEMIYNIKHSVNPSTFGIDWHEKYGQEEVGYRCHRPAPYCAPHVTVYHPIFTQFEEYL
jgi:hypothetical protein